jgi:phosphate/sulfate permease
MYNREVILSSLSGVPVSTIHVLSVCIVDLSLLQGGKVEEVRGPMDLVVELLGVGQLQVILHVGVVANT